MALLPFDFRSGPFVISHPGATQRSFQRAIYRRLPMGERDWKDEQRSVLIRLFDSAFNRREASDDEIEADIHRLGAANKRLKDDEVQGVAS
jgi:hypothetical protein